jgi:hypothetical protein
MSRSAGISRNVKGAVAATALLSFLTLAGCANGDQAMADKLAAAEAAASRAEAAQHAAEKAAATAVTAHPAPGPQPAMTADTYSENDTSSGGADLSDRGEDAFSTGSSGQTVAGDGTGNPGQGA